MNLESEQLTVDVCRPEFAAAWMNLGIVQAALKQLSDAERSYRTALRHRRRYADCYNMYSSYFNRFERAQRVLQQYITSRYFTLVIIV